MSTPPRRMIRARAAEIWSRLTRIVLIPLVLIVFLSQVLVSIVLDDDDVVQC